MLGFRKPPRREFNYTPLFYKKPEGDLRERLRIPRNEDHFKRRRSSLHWLFLLVVFLGLFEYLFPGVVRRFFQPDVEIQLHERLQRLVPDQVMERTDSHDGTPGSAPD